MELALVQIRNKAVCISFQTNVLGKGINLSVQSPSYEEIVGQTKLFVLLR